MLKSSDGIRRTSTRSKVKSDGRPKKGRLEREAVEDFQSFVDEMFPDSRNNQNREMNEHGLPSLAWLKETYKTKSAAIRYLVSEGFEIKHIAKHLDIKYQHARNVANQTLKRGPNEDWRPPEKRDVKPPMFEGEHEDEG